MQKNLEYYLSLNYPYTITEDVEEGKTYFVAEIPDLPGCGAHGETLDEAKLSLDEAKRLWLEVSFEKGLPIPEPVAEDEFSGKFILRLPPKLHMILSIEARQAGMSLNQYIRNKLEENLTFSQIFQELKEIKAKVSKIEMQSFIGTAASISQGPWRTGTLNDANIGEFWNFSLREAEGPLEDRGLEEAV